MRMGSSSSSGRDGRKPRKAERAVAKPARLNGSTRSKIGKGADAGNGLMKITIPSDYTAGRELQKRILDEVVANGFGENNLFAIKLSLEEALINAVKHGNRCNCEKKVHVEYAITPKKAEIVIEDEGTGFRRDEVPDPTNEENIVKCNGRGILLIEAYMDKVEYSRGGRRLRMIKKNVARPAKRA
jgi:serine/threonine-protein kinase RsbW